MTKVAREVKRKRNRNLFPLFNHNSGFTQQRGNCADGGELRSDQRADGTNFFGHTKTPPRYVRK